MMLPSPGWLAKMETTHMAHFPTIIMPTTVMKNRLAVSVVGGCVCSSIQPETTQRQHILIDVFILLEWSFKNCHFISIHTRFDPSGMCTEEGIAQPSTYSLTGRGHWNNIRYRNWVNQAPLPLIGTRIVSTVTGARFCHLIDKIRHRAM